MHGVIFSCMVLLHGSFGFGAAFMCLEQLVDPLNEYINSLIDHFT